MYAPAFITLNNDLKILCFPLNLINKVFCYDLINDNCIHFNERMYFDHPLCLPLVLVPFTCTTLDLKNHNQ